MRGPRLVLTLVALAGTARAACPVGAVISVDNDTPGSGYSEVKPANWVTNTVNACKGSYRYLSLYAGDGTRKGKAIWQPAIAVAGTYEVTTSFRATPNRTNDADYILYDDLGGTKKKSVNQQVGTDCTKVVIGSIYCKPGGTCRLVLDGDDGQSDSADLTTFKLLTCDDPGDGGTAGPCSGIEAVSSYELCEETTTTCAGVFNDGAGCTAFCAAAGMQCTASFGASAGCAKEPQNPLPCNTTGHQSDWCECAAPAGSGGTGGSSGGTGGTGGSAGSTGTGGSAGLTDASAGSAGTLAGGTGSSAGTGATVGKVDAGGGTSPTGGTTEADDGGCGCRATRPGGTNALLFLACVALGLARRRR